MHSSPLCRRPRLAFPPAFFHVSLYNGHGEWRRHWLLINLESPSNSQRSTPHLSLLFDRNPRIRIHGHRSAGESGGATPLAGADGREARRGRGFRDVVGAVQRALRPEGRRISGRTLRSSSHLRHFLVSSSNWAQNCRLLVLIVLIDPGPVDEE